MKKLLLALALAAACSAMAGCRKAEPPQTPPAPPSEAPAKEPKATPNPPEAMLLPPVNVTPLPPVQAPPPKLPMPDVQSKVTPISPTSLQWGDVTVDFFSQTDGWPDFTDLMGKPIGRRTPGQGVVLNLLKPAPGDEGLPQQSVIGELIPSRVTSASAEVNVRVSRIRGKLAAGGALSDFEVDFQRSPQGILVTYTLTWAGPPDALIASHGIRIPFAFGPDPRRAKIVAAAAGRPRGEIWRVDQNDMWHVYWMLSDRKERWPLWRLGGIYQDSPDHYSIWKANRADAAPVVVDRGQASPGWLDVSDTDRGVTVIWEDMAKRAPCAVTVNYPAGLIEVWFHPASAGARTAESLGLVPGKPVAWKFLLAYHDDVFPTTQKQERPREVVVELLRLIDGQKLWPYIAYNMQVPMTGDLDARIRLAVDSGVQPSEILAEFDSGDAWRMKHLCQAIGAPHTNDPSANAAAVLEWCRRRAVDRKTEPKPAESEGKGPP